MSAPSFIKKRQRDLSTLEFPITLDDEEVSPLAPTTATSVATVTPADKNAIAAAKQPLTCQSVKKNKKGPELAPSQSSALGEMVGCHVTDEELGQLASMSPNKATEEVAQHLIKATYMYLSRARQMQLAVEADRAKYVELAKLRNDLQKLQTSSKKETYVLKLLLKNKEKEVTALSSEHKKALNKLQLEKATESSSLQKTLAERDALVTKLKESMEKLKFRANEALKRSHDAGWQAGMEDYVYDFVRIMHNLVEKAKKQILANTEREVAQRAAEQAAAGKAVLGATTSGGPATTQPATKEGEGSSKDGVGASKDGLGNP